MFDIGFSEIVVIGVVALIVIGPERLPKVARTLGHMFGRLQRYVNEVKADINREMESGVRSVESQLNEAAAGASASAAPSPPAGNVSATPAGAAQPPNDAPASPTTASAPEQASLPGFERI